MIYIIYEEFETQHGSTGFCIYGAYSSYESAKEVCKLLNSGNYGYVKYYMRFTTLDHFPDKSLMKI